MRRNDVKAIVVTGNGGKSSGGFDINVLQEVQQTEAMKPFVATIQGLALGGGLELAMSCHAHISTPKAQLGFPELHFGIILGFGDHWIVIAPGVHVIVVSMNGFFCFLASIMTIWGGLLH